MSRGPDEGRKSEPQDDWLERLDEERRKQNPAYAELEARIAAEGPSYIVERMTDGHGRILDKPQVVATSHPADLAATAGDADAGRAAPSAYHAMGYKNADSMERKAMVVRALAERVEALELSHSEAARRLGMGEDELARLLRGLFRREAEADLAALLARLA